ncbi:MAG: xanthine dehydrogenase family protein molybdopterin-binding subunit [Steroidobacteraceae bacterium]|nr:xanthine dehydrogenase family protein molybdopterin-binding subunit [Steroidobacteraceae bacterium]
MMDALDHPLVTRRRFLGAGGALVVSFSLGPRVGAAQSAFVRPGDLNDARYLDAWIRIDAEGRISVFTGKAELGQGIRTALIQLAAEELDVAPDSIHLVTADTGLTPNEGYTAGSRSIVDSGTAIRNAAAQVRDLLVAAAAARWQLPPARLKAENGAVVSDDGRTLQYGELVASTQLHVVAQPQSNLKKPVFSRVMGKSLARVDIPAKVTGGAAYVQDLRLPKMLHARVVRPPGPGANLLDVDSGAVTKMPGVVKVIRDGSFLAVAAVGEFQAIQAMRALAEAARWNERPTLPRAGSVPTFILNFRAEDHTVRDTRTSSVRAGRALEATYTRPYQCHASIGPSCAVALFDKGSITVWTHTQGVYPDRAAIAQMLRLPLDKVRCIHMEGAGCYGHNGADDAAADTALIARALPGRPVRLEWMREQEHAWEPYGPAMITKIRATLEDSGSISDWNYELWSNTHLTRPGSAGALLPAQSLAQPFAPDEQHVEITPEGTADRNSVPIYTIPNQHIVWHFLREMPLRTSALRALGAYMNVFSIESFMDELAHAAGADPVQFRLRHLRDERAREVITTAAKAFGWSGSALPRNHGRGFAFARYKNLAAYCAVAIDVEIERETGRARMTRAVAAVDSGEIVNPDGIRNQTEGGILQSMSWTLFEAVTFDDTRVTSIDWSTYPVLRFSSVPDRVEVHLVPRPGRPFLGVGEAAQGPTAAALANAIANATGKRLRDIPFTPDRVRAAMGVL